MPRAIDTLRELDACVDPLCGRAARLIRALQAKATAPAALREALLRIRERTRSDAADVATAIDALRDIYYTANTALAADGHLFARPAVQWEFKSGWWQYELASASVTLEKRPVYCDRGHFVGKVFGVADIDSADHFPRYYMDAERGKDELADWLHWRLRIPKGG